MQLILTENIRGLGSTGEIVTVRDGYARNYLLPRKLGMFPTPENQKRFRKAREEYLLKEKDKIEAARIIAGRLADFHLNIQMKANDAGHLFGSVTEAIVAEKVGEAIKVELNPQNIILATHFKRIGDYAAIIRLHSEVEVEIGLTVAPEETGEQMLTAEQMLEKIDATKEEGEAAAGEGSEKPEA